MITVDDQPVPWQAGLTVADLLKQIDATGHCAVIRLNGRVVCRPQFDATIVPDEATIVLLPMIAGG